MCLPYLSNSRYESDYECICIVINGKICSFPLNILSSVISSMVRVKWTHKILVLIASANSEGSDEPAYERSLTRAFTTLILEVWM